VSTVPVETLTKPAQRASLHATAPLADAEIQAAQRQVERVRRLKLHVAAWTLGTILVTVVWIVHEWQANGAFARFAHEGNTGDWNPTLWAATILVWGLVVGSMALRVHFERPAAAAAVDRQLQRVSRLKSNIAIWLLAMAVLTPVNVLIEWQDNGGFERLSRNSQPGSWEPWILIVGGIWAGVIVLRFALPVYLGRRKAGS
jgi:hypothetical protein